jgi:hypothetical protein
MSFCEDIVVEVVKRPQPVIWILHEWYGLTYTIHFDLYLLSFLSIVYRWTDEMILENLSIRSMTGLTLQTIKDALAKATMIVFVCEAQRKLYHPRGKYYLQIHWILI